MIALLAILLAIAITAAMRFELNAASWRRKHDKLAVENEALRCYDLDAFHDHELDEGRTAAFRLHLETCDRCRDVLGGRMAETATATIAETPDRWESWAPQQCTASIACPREACGAARGERCKTDEPVHHERWDAWKAVCFRR